MKRNKLQEAFTRIPAHWRATAMLQGFGLFKVPLLFSVRPRVRRLDFERCEVEIPLTRWTKNHLGSMYFGALAIGADCVVGLHALHHAEQEKQAKVVLAFKDFRADFLKRPEGNVLFVSEAGATIASFVDEVLKSSERKNLTVPCHAALVETGEVVARFHLTLSLKKKG